MNRENEEKLKEIDNRLYLLNQQKLKTANQLAQLSLKIDSLMKEIKAKGIK